MSRKHSKYLSLIVLVLGGCASVVEYLPTAPYEEQTEEQASSSGTGRMAIASQGRFSTSIATDIEMAGGNAVDVAVAMSFAISVERPFSTGIGGGGFMLLHIPAIGKEPARTEAWDFRERAPIQSYKKMFLSKATGKPDSMKSRQGPLAVGVPGLVAGLWEIHQKYGKLSWKQVVTPSVDLARRGFEVYEELAVALEDKKTELAANPAAKAIFYNQEEGRVWRKGELLIQSDLAETLEQIAKDGVKSFYRGWIAKRMIRDIKSQGGVMTLEDLMQYEVKKHVPIFGEFKGYKIATMPPPSSGGVHMLQILNTVEDDPLKEWGPLDPRSVHLVSTAMQKAFVDRAEYMGDPAFVKVPANVLSSKKYARGVRARINMNAAMAPGEWKPGPVTPPYETDHTAHFSIISSDGYAVASTQTINGWFGAKFVAKGTGIVMNNEMDDFSAAIGAKNLYGATASSTANLVAPKKTPLSSMTPSLVFKGTDPIISLGTPSGTRILTCVSQVLLNRLAFGMTPYQAVSQIRYHQQWSPDEIRVDAPGLPEATSKKLLAMGHKINNSNLGCRVQFVERDSASGVFTAVSDPRGEAWTAVTPVKEEK